MYNFSSADIITPSQSLKFIHNITDVDKIPKLTEGFIILGYFNYFYKKQTFETKEIVINNDIIECEIFDINKLNNFDRQLIINIFLKTEVEVTEDNTWAKIYWTVLNEEKRNDVSKALDSAKGFIRSELSHGFKTYTIPQLKFIYDESMQRGSKILSVLNKVKEDFNDDDEK